MGTLPIHITALKLKGRPPPTLQGGRDILYLPDEKHTITFT